MEMYKCLTFAPALFKTMKTLHRFILLFGRHTQSDLLWFRRLIQTTKSAMSTISSVRWKRQRGHLLTLWIRPPLHHWKPERRKCLKTSLIIRLQETQSKCLRKWARRFWATLTRLCVQTVTPNISTLSGMPV